MTAWIRGVATSATGAVRELNEDAVFFAVAREMALAIVADGCGGRSAGRAAADRAIASARATFARRFVVLAETWWQGEHGAALPDGEHTRTSAHVRALLETRRSETPGDVAVLGHGLVDLARRAMVDANRAVHEQARDPRHRGHGAAIEIAVLAPGTCAIAHVGDTRVYRLRDGVLGQITEDHTLLNMLRKEHAMSAQEIEDFPHKNVIVRALGTSETVEVDVALHAVGPDDTLLFCSDGLYNTLTEARIHEVLQQHGAEAAARLVDEAKRSSQDNVSALTLVCRDRSAPAPS